MSLDPVPHVDGAPSVHDEPTAGRRHADALTLATLLAHGDVERVDRRATIDRLATLLGEYESLADAARRVVQARHEGTVREFFRALDALAVEVSGEGR